jgi:hypothetical protein
MVHAEVIHSLMAVLRESAANGKKAETTINVPSSTEELREKR